MSVHLFGNVDSDQDREVKNTDEVFVGNKQVTGQLSHIFIDDGGLFGASLIGASLPVTLLPAVPADGDAIYFGIESTLTDANPFDNIVFNITTEAVYTGAATIVWEYWSGAAFAALSPDDQTTDAGDSWTLFGVKNVSWDVPTDWLTTGAGNVINGVRAWWVRARVSLGGGTISTPPVQSDRNPYSTIWPYTEIQAADVAGDIHAPSRIIMRARTETVANGSISHVNMGLRSMDRGPDFRAYLNFSDSQNPLGVTMTIAAADATVTTAIGVAAAGEYVNWNPSGNVEAEVASFDMDSSIAYQYAGEFRAYLRVLTDNSLANANWDIALEVRSPSGGSNDALLDRVEVRFKSGGTNLPLIIDLGIIRVPHVALGGAGNPSFRFEIAIGADRNDQDLNLCDLVLIPTDEWYAEMRTDQVEKFSNAAFLLISRYFDLDNVTIPRRFLANLRENKNDAAGMIPYRSAAEASFIQSQERQRLFFMQRTATSSSISAWAFNDLLSVQVQHLSRYMGLRGDK